MKADEIDKNTPTVGFIKLTGIIQSQKARTPVFVRKNDVITPKLVRDEIHRYMKRGDLDAIVLQINSPGGTVIAADAIARIITLAAEEIPIFVYSDQVLASGGYYISAPAQKIFAAPQAQVGSIGVIYKSVNYEKLAKDRLGIETTIFKHGKFKDLGNPMREITPAEKEIMQQKIDDAYKSFKNIILTHREFDDKQMEEVETALTFSGIVAKKNGLVDDILYLDELPGRMAKELGVETIYFVNRERETGEGILGKLLLRIDNFWNPITQFVENLNINHTGLLYLHQF
jgi:signal peptide peptidase SppA